MNNSICFGLLVCVFSFYLPTWRRKISIWTAYIKSPPEKLTVALFSRCLTSVARPLTHIGRFSKPGLQEWMPFIIFCARSRERSQLPLPGRFLSRHWFMLCITMEVEPRTAKQRKCHYCCICKKYRGKVIENGEKMSLHNFGADQNIASSWKKCIFLASYCTSNNLLLVARHILTTGLQKCP